MESTAVKTVVREYWKESAERYDKFHQSEREHASWKELLRMVLGPAGGLKVLDVGTGTGVIALALAAAGQRVTALDLTAEMVEKAKANAERRGLAVDFRIGDAEKLPFESNTFDVVTNKWLLWTLPDPEKAISEWQRVLKPGGRLIIIDGNWWDFRKSWAKRAWYHFLSMPLILITERRYAWNSYGHLVQHLPMISKKRPEADVEMLERLGFTGVEIKTVPIPIAQTFIRQLKYGYQGGQFLVKGVRE
ncbi:methyltransferase domain-containing protein [Thermodesulfovibrionales bacterium]|nr:methyltransferase domain-containing protein [Thermodesulfovibrionales bacterium]